jgi:signal transduction histidine kinase
VRTERTLAARVRGIDLHLIDRVLAVLLTLGALADAASQPHRELNALAIVSLVALTSSVAWRRRNPAVTTLVAVVGFGAFQLASHYRGDGAFEVAAVALNFYLLGCRAQDRATLFVCALVFAAWLAGAAVVAYSVPGGSVGAVLGAWALVGGLPFAVGRTLASRRALTRELERSAGRLAVEQELRARGARVQERNRMMRELHDVIAHNVSVMVIQTSAARRVAHADHNAARDAVQAVERSGREALVELRRIVGVVRCEDGELAGSPAPGLSQLDALVDRARAAGLPVQLHVEGEPGTLSPGLDLVAYRVVQEALTNAIKHAGPAQARVNVSVDARAIALEVSDSGNGPAPGRDRDGSGHGLLGMNERVALYGGDLCAGPRIGGGFEIRALIPLDGVAASLPRAASSSESPPVAVAVSDRVRWPWLDTLLAAVSLAVLEIAVLTSSHRGGLLALNVIVLAAMALAALWRRRSPLLSLIVVGGLATTLDAGLTSVSNLPLVGLYVALIPTYAVAAWEERRRALLGLAIFICGSAINTLILNHGTFGDVLGATFAMGAAWAAGRTIRARHTMTSELERRSARLVLEREARASLAVAGERSRIARELHAAVAQTVAAMIVQAEAARSLLGGDLAQADLAMGAIENTGRETLGEMRRILGVLRTDDDVDELEPQPGVDQIYALIQRARDRGQPIELSVDGDPGTLPAGVDLGVYRILEEALKSAHNQPGSSVSVALCFGEEDLALHLTAGCHGPSGWPTDAMRERVALCGGQLDTDVPSLDGWQFNAVMPRGLQGALA